MPRVPDSELLVSREKALSVLHNYFVPTLTGQVSVGACVEGYAVSHYGMYQASQELRFAVDFGSYRPTMREELGLDVDPNGHQILTGYFMAQIIEAQRKIDKDFISDEEAGVAVFTGASHDVGEGMHPALGCVVGDIPYGKKTDDDRANEAMVYQTVMDEVFAYINPVVRSEARLIVGHHATSLKYRIYKAAHCVQTLETARIAKNLSNLKLDQAIDRAFMTIISEDTRPDFTERWQQFRDAIGKDVLDYGDIDAAEKAGKLHELYKAVVYSQTPNLVMHAQEFAYMDNYAQTYMRRGRLVY